MPVKAAEREVVTPQTAQDPNWLELAPKTPALMRFAVLLALAGALPSTDIHRARTRKPRDAYRGHSLDKANAALNAHLKAKM